MKMLLFWVEILALVFTISIARAQENITSAFDMTLGDFFDSTQATETRETESGETLYGFRPSKPYSKLNSYMVMLTPTTNRIIEIWAVGIFDEKEECERELTTIGKLLEKRYPAAKRSTPIMMGEAVVFATGDTYVAAFCPLAFSSARLIVKYVSGEMRRLSEDERAEKAAEEDPGASSF